MPCCWLDDAATFCSFITRLSEDRLQPAADSTTRQRVALLKRLVLACLEASSVPQLLMMDSPLSVADCGDNCNASHWEDREADARTVRIRSGPKLQILLGHSPKLAVESPLVGGARGAVLQPWLVNYRPLLTLLPSCCLFSNSNSSNPSE
ncbi:unnamed protein product [Symbiodinium microadriaticum]|nr:unnamed protein product [Symbiodinium microadriaticum]